LALRSQDREAEAIGAYRTALSIEPNDFQCHSSLAGAHGALGQYADEKRHYLAAIRLKPHDVKAHLNLAVSHSSLDELDEAEAAYLAAGRVAPTDGRPPLNLARFLVKLQRPAEAVAAFRLAATLDGANEKDAMLGEGTARAQQGRLEEATASFAAALASDPGDGQLQASFDAMSAQAAALASVQASTTNALPDICGTPCQDVVDYNSLAMCELTWEAGCGDAPPPSHFSKESTLQELCGYSCAYSRLTRAGQQ